MCFGNAIAQASLIEEQAMLRIWTEEQTGSWTIKLEGRLKGPWVLELEQCLNKLTQKDTLILDLTGLEFVDTAGRYLLKLLKERGARFLASGPLMTELVADLDRPLIPGSNIGLMGVLMICAFLFALLRPALAQERTEFLNFARTAELARSRSLQVKVGRQGAMTAKYAVAQAKALRYGKMAVDASYLRLDGPIEINSGPVHVPLFGGAAIAVPPVRLAPNDLAHVRLEAGLPLFTGGRISNAIAAARAGQTAAEALNDDMEAAAVLESGQLYLGALLAADLVKLNEQALASYKRHLEEARTAYRLGAVAYYDVIRVETALADQEKRLIEARNHAELIEAALKTLLDLPESTAIVIQDCIFEAPEPQPFEQLKEAALAGNAALAALKKKLEALERATRMEQAEYFPQVIAVAGKETLTTKLPQTEPNWFVGMRASWALWDGGARKARAAARASEAAGVRLELRHAEEQLLLALRSALLEYHSQKSALNSARKTATLARTSLDLAGKRFAAGAGTSLEVIDANVALTAAETGEGNCLYQMNTAYLRLHRYLGDLSRVAAQIR